MRLWKLRRKGIINIGNALLGFGIGIALVLVAILLAGVIAGTMQDVFTDLNLNGTVWDQMRTQAESYTQTGMNIALVGIVLTAVGVLLTVVFSFVRTARGD